MMLSAFATIYQTGVFFHAGWGLCAVKTAAEAGICACASNSACTRGRSAAPTATGLNEGIRMAGRYAPDHVTEKG
jgi:hypothetical protein